VPTTESTNAAGFHLATVDMALSSHPPMRVEVVAITMAPKRQLECTKGPHAVRRHTLDSGAQECRTYDCFAPCPASPPPNTVRAVPTRFPSPWHADISKSSWITDYPLGVVDASLMERFRAIKAN
jgi:hypothetical protein